MNKEQISFLLSIGINPNSDLDEIEDKVGDYLTLHCLNVNYEPNADGLMCESILDYIAKQ